MSSAHLSSRLLAFQRFAPTLDPAAPGGRRNQSSGLFGFSGLGRSGSGRCAHRAASGSPHHAPSRHHAGLAHAVERCHRRALSALDESPPIADHQPARQVLTLSQ